MKKKLIAMILTAAMALGMAACGAANASSGSSAAGSSASGSSTGATASASGGTGEIGFVTIAYTDEFCTLLAKQIQEKAGDLGYNVTLTDGKNDPQIQIDLMQSFIAKGVDAIVLQAADCAGIVPGVNACNDAGIPLICSEVVPTDGNFTYAGPESVQAGQMQGELLAELLPDGGKVLYLQGTSGMTHALQRREGFEAAIEGKGFEVLDAQDGDFVKDEGMRITETWIQSYADGDGVAFDAIISGNDQMILGAMEALKTAGIPDGDVILMGIDGTAPAVKAVNDGQMTATVFQSSEKVADVTVQCLQDLADGKDLEPTYTIDWEMVTKDNCADYPME